MLTAIRHGCTVAEATRHLFANAQRHLKSPAEMAAMFADVPDALRRTVEIAERCTFSLDELRYEYPEELAPPGLTPSEYLARLTWAGAAVLAARPARKSSPPVGARAATDRGVALRGLFSDGLGPGAVRPAARHPLPGAGSAANSAVCYCLGITAVDPERMDVLFERFISRERNGRPISTSTSSTSGARR